MKIFFNGSSFAFGSYPDHLAKLFDIKEYTNISRPGYSNRSIWRTTLEENPKNYDLAIVQLTSPSRTEFFNGRKWIEVSPQLNHKNITGWIKKLWQTWYGEVYSDEYGQLHEDFALTGIRDHFSVANIPCIMVTAEKYTKSKKFDLNLWDIDFPLDNTRHPTDEGHKMIAKRIYEIFISR